MNGKREGSRYIHNFGRKKSRFEGHSKRPILPIFEPSGLLELESNQKDGIQLKHVEPEDAMSPDKYNSLYNIPKLERVRYELIIYRKGIKGEMSRTALNNKSCYVIGRGLGRSLRDVDTDKEEVIIADISIPEESCSKEHCAIQFRQKNDTLMPYLIDLDSSNGTSLNGSSIPSSRYIELKSGDIICVSEDENDTDFELVFVAV